MNPDDKGLLRLSKSCHVAINVKSNGKVICDHYNQLCRGSQDDEAFLNNGVPVCSLFLFLKAIVIQWKYFNGSTPYGRVIGETGYEEKVENDREMGEMWKGTIKDDGKRAIGVWLGFDRLFSGIQLTNERIVHMCSCPSFLSWPILYLVGLPESSKDFRSATEQPEVVYKGKITGWSDLS